MPYKIILDAGHGGSDPGATFEGRQEKDDALALAMAVGRILADAGFDVEYTRDSDVYNTPFEKATIANNAGGDLFVSFHRNSSPTANMYDGVQTLVYNNSGMKADLARNINANLSALGFADKGVVERPNLVVLKRTRMPAVLIETGFINSNKDNELHDSQFDNIAQAIANAIAGTLNNYGIAASVPITSAYSVQVGAFRNSRLATNLSAQLNNQGFPVQVINQGNLFKVRVGNYQDLSNAVAMEQRLRSFGYNTFITR